MNNKEYKPSHGGYCKPCLSECIGEFIKSVSEVIGSIKSLKGAVQGGEEFIMTTRGPRDNLGAVICGTEEQIDNFLLPCGKESQLTENYPLLPASGKYKDPQSGALCPKCKIRGIPSFLPHCHHCESLSRNHAH